MTESQTEKRTDGAYIEPSTFMTWPVMKTYVDSLEDNMTHQRAKYEDNQTKESKTYWGIIEKKIETGRKLLAEANYVEQPSTDTSSVKKIVFKEIPVEEFVAAQLVEQPKAEEKKAAKQGNSKPFVNDELVEKPTKSTTKTAPKKSKDTKGVDFKAHVLKLAYVDNYTAFGAFEKAYKDFKSSEPVPTYAASYLHSYKSFFKKKKEAGDKEIIKLMKEYEIFKLV